MTIGGSIVLFVIGAILSFAVADRIDAVDLTMVGYILMGAGVVGFIAGLVLRGRSAHPRDPGV
ncbi:DUF6458 family protein [Nesterenkonia alkaliphila]|uniref:DUF6458 domain-containing protein n=1 Tax=Nesterenkonia alkaliphila TaxID=1463631 RepID=A0A7K1UKE1_9MICC|nr:DUF6458 family protein [Nesterenkonia alkaliphila]MVT26940.1 hypothetical protein [Nesterenkonia alkaliphila]GFZ90491.1 hypothetical protein GCM10011359_19880 [Nesterenkonia alkaliphila]